MTKSHSKRNFSWIWGAGSIFLSLLDWVMLEGKNPAFFPLASPAQLWAGCWPASISPMWLKIGWHEKPQMWARTGTSYVLLDRLALKHRSLNLSPKESCVLVGMPVFSMSHLLNASTKTSCLQLSPLPFWKFPHPVGYCHQLWNPLSP